MARRPTVTRTARIMLLIMLCMALAPPGCERADVSPPNAQSPGDAGDAVSPWVASVRGAHVTLTGTTDTDALQSAIAEAHQSLEDARTRWQVATAEQRRNWSIKWAARTWEGGVDHVWVRPTHWSAWRVEGILLSQSTRELESGASAGDAVSFAIDDLTDWLYLIDGRVDGPRNGGFTLDLLQESFGPPPSVR